MDQVSPALMSSAVWTWAGGEPSNPTDPSADCTLLDSTDGRWYTADCKDTYLEAACRLADNATQGKRVALCVLV